MRPTSIPGRLSIEQIAYPFAVPVVLPEESLSRKASCPLDAVQVIQHPLIPHARIVIGLKVLLQPAHAAAQRPIRWRLTVAALRAAVRIRGVVEAQHLSADDERADARAGHASRAVIRLRDVAPPVVGILIANEVFEGHFPSLVLDVDSGQGRIVQAEEGELRVAVVAPHGDVAITPHSALHAPRRLHGLERFCQGRNPRAVFVPFPGGDENHQQKRAIVGPAQYCRIVNSPQVFECPRNAGILNAQVRIQQGQRGQGSWPESNRPALHDAHTRNDDPAICGPRHARLHPHTGRK